ncbi:hypothetical protein EXU34_10460 [Alteromonas sp. ZYF713]|nr:hypothetical protein [Alteromonas sp. ZYF713]
MNPRIYAKSDNLNDLNADYEQTPLQQGVFLNSVPKCGTHLLRNIFRMFVPVEQQYHNDFIQFPTLPKNMAAFDPASPKLSWGHLLFSDQSALALSTVKQVLIVRDPYDWVLARARFFLSDTFQAQLDHLKSGKLTIEEILNMMIFGIHQRVPDLKDIFTHNGVAWLGTGVKLVRYEELISHLNDLNSKRAEAYFTDLLSVLGINELPDDWQQRVATGSDRKQSGTARENLKEVSYEIPATLPPAQRLLVDFAAPGLRQILGYN